MRKPTIIFAAIALFARCIIAIQPFPGGCTIRWTDVAQSPGWSNISFIVWKFAPGVPDPVVLTNTTATSFRFVGNVPFQTQFGVSAVGQSNRVFYQTDVGLALYPPALTNGPGFVVLTPNGPWTVPTNQWLKTSDDLKSWTARQRFGISGSNVLLEFSEATNGRAGFIAVTTITNPPSPSPGGLP